MTRLDPGNWADEIDDSKELALRRITLEIVADRLTELAVPENRPVSK